MRLKSTSPTPPSGINSNSAGMRPNRAWPTPFLTDVDAAIRSAAENPTRFPRLRRKPEVRRVLTRRFPYRIFFIRQPDTIVVLRALHAARHDREWQRQA